MARLFAFQYRGVLAAMSVALVLFYRFVLYPAASERSGSSSNKVINLQKAHNTAMFVAVLWQWSASNERAVAIVKHDNVVRLDSSFPIICALGFA